jgi:hypothetical protein
MNRQINGSKDKFRNINSHNIEKCEFRKSNSYNQSRVKEEGNLRGSEHTETQHRGRISCYQESHAI